MKSKLLLGLALVLSGGLFGCSTASETTSDPEWDKVLNEQPYSDGVRNPFFSKETRTAATREGKVVAIRKTAKVLKSITAELTPLKTELGVIGKPGDTVIIHFDEPFSHLRGLQLAVGSTVRLVVFTTNGGSNRPDELRSRCSRLGIKNNGIFCYSNGAKMN